jgi:Mn-containing catalase
MQTATTAKPPYLGLLNAISLAESRAGVYLTAWADVTDDEDLAATLRLVAARETSHGDLFCRRLCELGYALRPKPDPKSAEQLAKYANPKISDCEKIGEEREEAGDPFREINQQLADGAFDPMTANMLSWYIGEERDSAKRLRAAYAKVRAKANGHAAKANGHGMDASVPSADAEAIMACMTAGFSRLEKSLEKLARAVK